MNIDLRFGDCSELMKGIDSESIDLIVTDPPYGKNYKSNRQGIDRKQSIAGTEKIVREQYFTTINNDESFPFLWLTEAYRTLKQSSAIYIFAHWEKWEDVKFRVDDVGFQVKNMIVLNKSNHGMGDLYGDYAPKHELLLYATKGRHILTFPDKRMNNVWDVPVKFSGAHRLHPNEKPPSWYLPAILNSSKMGDIVLDPFMGSGTCGDVCKQVDRNFIGMENDEVHYQTAQTRLA